MVIRVLHLDLHEPRAHPVEPSARQHRVAVRRQPYSRVSLRVEEQVGDGGAGDGAEHVYYDVGARVAGAPEDAVGAVTGGEEGAAAG